MTLQLSDVAAAAGLTVVRDASFACVGYLSDDRDGLVVSLFDAAWLDRVIAHPTVVAVLTTPDLAAEIPENLGIATCDEPRDGMYLVHLAMLGRPSELWSGFTTEIAADAVVHPSAVIAPRNVRIGSGVRIDAGAVIHEHTLIDDDAHIGSGAVISGDGFEVRTIKGRHMVVPHSGGVHIGRGASVLANSSVCRSLFGGLTIIGAESHIDALVQVAHGVRIGERCGIAAQTVISGATVLGDDCWVAPGAVLSSGLVLGDRVRVMIGERVLRNVPDDHAVFRNKTLPRAKLDDLMRAMR